MSDTDNKAPDESKSGDTKTTAPEKQSPKPATKTAAKAAPLPKVSSEVRDEKNPDGTYRSTPKSGDELTEMDKEVRDKSRESENMVMARCLTGGKMYHFESDTWIGDRYVEVPFTPWLRMQILAKKIEVREEK